MLTQAVSRVPANLWAVNVALDLEDREFFLQDFDELRIGVGGAFRIPQRGSVVLGLSPEGMRILTNVTESLVECRQDTRGEGPIPLSRPLRVDVWSTRLPVAGTRRRCLFVVGWRQRGGNRLGGGCRLSLCSRTAASPSRTDGGGLLSEAEHCARWSRHKSRLGNESKHPAFHQTMRVNQPSNQIKYSCASLVA